MGVVFHLSFLICCSVIANAATYTNPVLARDFPDPTVIRGQDGIFYVYGTMSGGLHIQVASSPDLVNWNYLGEALPTMPAWWVGPNTWAPDVSFHNGTYFMYYGGSGSIGMCIGVATSSSPSGPFVDVGAPVMCAPNFGDIDPKAYDDPITGQPYIFWGSDFQPIQVQALSSSRISLLEGSSPIVLLNTNASNPYESLIEGTWIAPRPNGEEGFHLFFSGNNCCYPTANYAVMVARASNLTGPYTTIQHATGSADDVILQKNGAFIAPGHNSVITDDEGNDWTMYHAYESSDPSGPRFLMLDRVWYNNTDSWPFIGTPSSNPQPVPVISTI